MRCLLALADNILLVHSYVSLSCDCHASADRHDDRESEDHPGNSGVAGLAYGIQDSCPDGSDGEANHSIKQTIGCEEHSNHANSG